MIKPVTGRFPDFACAPKNCMIFLSLKELTEGEAP